MQVGDRVRCVNASAGLAENEYYTVLDVRDRFCTVNTEGEFTGREYFTHRFVVENEPVRPQPAKHTVTHYVLVWYSPEDNDVQTKFCSSLGLADYFETRYEERGYILLKKTIVRLEVDLPEGVVL